MDTLTPVPPAQVASFRATLEPVAARVCPRYGLDPQTCYSEAVAISGHGRFSVGFNHWNLLGRGSAGSYWAVVAPLDGGQAHGGVAPMRQQRAKFATLDEAVTAWCSAKRGA